MSDFMRIAHPGANYIPAKYYFKSEIIQLGENFCIFFFYFLRSTKTRNNSQCYITKLTFQRLHIHVRKNIAEEMSKAHFIPLSMYDSEWYSELCNDKMLLKSSFGALCSQACLQLLGSFGFISDFLEAGPGERILDKECSRDALPFDGLLA